MVNVDVPNAVFDATPHVSMLPVVAGLCAFGFSRSQSGTRFLFASVHDRVTPHGPNGPVVQGKRNVGLEFAQLFEMPIPSRYLPTLNLKAVRPLPNTSYARPILGVMSL